MQRADRPRNESGVLAAFERNYPGQLQVKQFVVFPNSMTDEKR